MSKTSSDVINILFQNIYNSLIFTDLNKPKGDLYKHQRPLNSDKEDIVINSLLLGHDAVQEGVINVNAYVKNLVLTINGNTDNSQPDTSRLTYLSTLINSALGSGNELWEASGNYVFKIQQDNIFQDGNNQHYINFRIEFYSLNI